MEESKTERHLEILVLPEWTDAKGKTQKHPHAMWDSEGNLVGGVVRYGGIGSQRAPVECRIGVWKRVRDEHTARVLAQRILSNPDLKAKHRLRFVELPKLEDLALTDGIEVLSAKESQEVVAADTGKLSDWKKRAAVAGKNVSATKAPKLVK